MTHSDSVRAQRVIALIDLTDLTDDHRPDGIAALLDRAAEHGTAAVCVWPEYVADASQRLADTGVAVATVVNFPSGDGEVSDVVAQTIRSLDAGADEIDLVLPYGSAIAGDFESGRVMVAAVADVVHARSAHLKVILETGELVERDLIASAGQTAVDAGADFLKTSTGKTSTGASLEAIDAMIDVIAAADRVVGLKPSGGISTVAAASDYLDLVERRLGQEATSADRFRFGASSLLGDAIAQLVDDTS